MLNITDAACISENPELFFPEGKNKKEDTYKAKQICATCPIISECLQYAIDNKVVAGVFGGTTEDERKTIIKR